MGGRRAGIFEVLIAGNFVVWVVGRVVVPVIRFQGILFFLFIIVFFLSLSAFLFISVVFSRACFLTSGCYA